MSELKQQGLANEELSEEAQISVRREKLAALRAAGQAYPNDFRRSHLAGKLHGQYDSHEGEALKAERIAVKIAGRMMTQRIMGKAAFAHLQDMSGRMQIYVRRDDLPEGQYQAFKHWDMGDIIAAEGYLFKTKTGELSVHVESIRLLVKALRPLPDKFHGLANQEMRYRQRYLDLIANDSSRQTFMIRFKTIQAIRNYLLTHNFLEVETPMMHPIPGGALAKPFETHHHALDMPLFLRVAPELYLKRLVVGGFERVFEINRSFRNEGLSTRHNPEFTMVEFYQAYADHHDLMDFTEQMLRQVAEEALGSTCFHYQGVDYDFAQPFTRLSLKQAILQYVPGLSTDSLETVASCRAIAKKLGMTLNNEQGVGSIQMAIFDEAVEGNLQQPTFITDFPIEVSPLSRRNDNNPDYADRFELFIAGRELANSFSELNDADDQAERFRHQSRVKAAGDEEAMYYDEDYITALEHGMPPTAGEGIGIDRLVMLFTDSASIRDVLLFPHMRPQQGGSGE